MADWVENVMSKLTESVRGAAFDSAIDIVDDIKRDLSTPYPPASSPGESPHLRIGNLQDGVDFNVDTGEPDRVTLAVTSDRVGGNPNVPLFLTIGTENMAPRDYMGAAMSRWAPVFPTRMAIMTKSRFG